MYCIIKYIKTTLAFVMYLVHWPCVYIINNPSILIWNILPLISNIVGQRTINYRQVFQFGIDQTPRVCELYERIKCENGGLVEEIEGSYACKCQNDFYGVRCEKELFFKPMSWMRRMFDNTEANLRKGKPTSWWSALPFTFDRQLENIYGFHQNNINKLGIYNGTNNNYNENLKENMINTRILPPAHPRECTRASRLYLTTLADVQRKLVQREPGAFKPDPKRRNILLDTFYKYFTLQFFDANFNFSVTASQVYGSDDKTRRELRLFSDGKLKTKILDGEHYPPPLSLFKRIERFVIGFLPIQFAFKSVWFNRIMYSSGRNGTANWAVGHQMSSMNPMFFVMTTLWVREHNRVCDVLHRNWPDWTDDELYNTARRIVIGEMMKIMMDEVLNTHVGHSLSLQYKPQLFNDRLKNINRFTTPFELLLTTMWPTSLPETFNNASTNSVSFSDNIQVMKYGLSKAVKYMVDHEIGMVTRSNYDDVAEPMTMLLMKLARENALQSFNNYRRKLGLNAYKSFYDLTDDTETAKILEELYDNIDGVELLTGMLTEKRKHGYLSTVQIMTNSLLASSIMTNPLMTREFWKPKTYGGQEGFDIVRSASIEKFVCNNLVNKCSDGLKVKLHAI